MTEEKKIWLVLQGVPSDKLEDKLNEHALLGYQAYRIDRVESRPDSFFLHTEVSYDVVLFNPILLGELNAAGMATMLAKAAAGASSVTGKSHP